MLLDYVVNFMSYKPFNYQLNFTNTKNLKTLLCMNESRINNFFHKVMTAGNLYELGADSYVRYFGWCCAAMDVYGFYFIIEHECILRVLLNRI